MRLNELVERWPRWGFWKCFGWLKTNGAKWNHKRVWRIYCLMKLNLPRRKKKTLLTRERKPLAALALPNHSWYLDFVHDALICGKRFRTLNVIDEGVRECLAIEIDTSYLLQGLSAHLIKLAHDVDTQSNCEWITDLN